MRISELVKTYRLLNDPDAPAWNVKFVGALSVVAAVALAAGGLYWATAVPAGGAAPGAVAAGAHGSGPGSGAALPPEALVAYVGFPPEGPGADPAAVAAALEAWRAAHPGAVVLSQEPAYGADGRLAGYLLRYLP